VVVTSTAKLAVIAATDDCSRMMMTMRQKLAPLGRRDQQRRGRLVLSTKQEQLS